MSPEPRPLLIAYCGIDSDPALVARALSGVAQQATVTCVDSAAALRQALDTSAAETTAAAHVEPAAVGAASQRIVVVPMTTGRNLPLIADAAKICRWARTTHPELRGRLALADAPLTATSTLARLRAALRKYTRPGDVAIICARSIDPFADAELFRLARLAWVNGSGADVAVAFDDAYPSVQQAVALYRGLSRHCFEPPSTGSPTVSHPTRGEQQQSESTTDETSRYTVIRADLHEPSAVNGHRLLPDSSLAAAFSQVSRLAVHLLNSHGDDGIDAALLADHDHGYAHSHGNEDHGHHHGHHNHHRHPEPSTIVHAGGDDAR